MVDSILRWLVQWKGRRKAAQIIVFDGGAEIDRIRSFVQGAVTGTVLSFAVILLAAPNTANTALLAEAERREVLLQESNERVAQAVEVANVCLNTAERMQRSVDHYQHLLRQR